MSSDEFDSSSTLYECIVFSKIYFGYILSYIGISERACSARYKFVFVLGINSCTLCLMIAEA